MNLLGQMARHTLGALLLIPIALLWLGQKELIPNLLYNTLFSSNRHIWDDNFVMATELGGFVGFGLLVLYHIIYNTSSIRLENIFTRTSPTEMETGSRPPTSRSSDLVFILLGLLSVTSGYFLVILVGYVNSEFDFSEPKPFQVEYVSSCGRRNAENCAVLERFRDGRSRPSTRKSRPIKELERFIGASQSKTALGRVLIK